MEKKIETIQTIEIKKGKVDVITNKETYSLSMDDFSNFYLYPNKELTLEEVNAIKEASQYRKVKTYLQTMLSSYRLTEKILKDKVKQKYQISDQKLDSLLSSLKDSSLLDDKQFALDYIADKKNKYYGKNYIIYQLKNKGIDEDILYSDEIQSLLDEEIDITPYISSLNNKKKNMLIEKRKEYVFTILYQRGFSSSYIKNQLEKYYKSQDEKENKEENNKSRTSLLNIDGVKCYNSISRRKTTAQKKKELFYQHLHKKGFNKEEINEFLERMGYKFYD